MFYNDKKIENDAFLLEPYSGSYGVHIPAGQWHTLEALESASVIFEVKDGLYTPLGKENILE